MNIYYFLTKQEVLKIHKEMIERYGGSAELWDEGKFDSAVAAPGAIYAGIMAHQNIFEIAAAYWYHISQAHAFADGNKRTACIACVMFLELNGFWLDCSNDELYQTGIDIATGAMSENKLVAWLKIRVKSKT